MLNSKPSMLPLTKRRPGEKQETRVLATSSRSSKHCWNLTLMSSELGELKDLANS